MQGRKKPYTQRGISRVKCARCGAPSIYQWNVCALDNTWCGLCLDCDVALNAMVLHFMGHPQAAAKAAAYEARARGSELSA